MKKLLSLLFFIPTVLFSQSRKERKALELQQKADQPLINSFKSHIQFLSSNQAINGNEATIKYISSEFQKAGLSQKGTNGFIQTFKVEDGKNIDPSTFLKVNETLLEVNKEYFPLPYSAEKRVTGMPAMALRERGVPWFADIKDWLEEPDKKPDFDIYQAIKKEAGRVASKGATALFLFNTSAIADGLRFVNKDKSSSLSIPVIYLTAVGYKKYFSDHSQILDIELNVAFKETATNGENVLGYLDNRAPTVVVISAHYNTGHKEGNGTTGADDNSSGVAMLIELSKMVSASKAKNNNYVFIALGGYDKGLAACNYWLDKPTIASPINYMLNLDMVGSYGDNKNLTIHGSNSSAEWNNIFTSVSDKKIIFGIDTSGAITGADSISYTRGIPVLSFSCAKHEDYLDGHDDESKINYQGELQITRFISRLIEATDSKGRIAFSKNSNRLIPAEKTTEASNVKTVISSAAVPKTSVSLGIIPDKNNTSEGLRISGLSPKKTGSKIGLEAGDILTYLGTYKIDDFKSYLQALSNFKTGDKTTLRIKRGKDDREFAVEF